MRIVKKSFAVAMVFIIFTLFSAEAWAKPKIGVLLFTQETHYKEALNGIMAQLKKEGFGESRADFIMENAEGSKIKVIELAKKFVETRVDLVIVLGTSATLIAMQEIKDIPIVFSMVYDPVGSGIARDWESSGNNTTGSSTYMPRMSNVIQVLKELAPLKKLAVLYQPNEKDSVAQLKELQEEQAKSQVSIVPVPITAKDDVTQLLPSVIGSADALYIASSSILGEMVPTIVDMATKAKLITIAKVKERAERGVLLGVYADSYAVGLLGGERAAKVLKGAKPSTIPIGTLKRFDIILNMKTAKAGQFKLPPKFMKKVTKTIE